MQFDIIASSGRTAITSLASVVDRSDGVAATHEGDRGFDHDAVTLFALHES